MSSYSSDSVKQDLDREYSESTESMSCTGTTCHTDLSIRPAEETHVPRWKYNRRNGKDRFFNFHPASLISKLARLCGQPRRDEVGHGDLVGPLNAGSEAELGVGSAAADACFSSRELLKTARHSHPRAVRIHPSDTAVNGSQHPFARTRPLSF